MRKQLRNFVAFGMLSLGLAALGTTGCEGCGTGPNPDADTGDDAMVDTMEDTTEDTAEDTSGDTMDTDGGGGGATARAMIIHNSADPQASTVDLFVNGDLFANDLSFQNALSFRNVPAGEQLEIAIAASSAGEPNSDETLDSGETTYHTANQTFTEDETYVVVANGTRDTSDFSGETGFQLNLESGALETGNSADQVEVLVHHGSTDAPNVSLRINNAGSPQVSDLGYGSFNGYTSLPATFNTIDVLNAEDNNSRVRSVQTPNVDEEEAWVVVASGFLDTSNNAGNNGLEFYAFQAKDKSETDTVSGMELSDAARAQIVHAAPQSAVDPVDVWENKTGRQFVDGLGYEDATPFVTVPAGVDLELSINQDGSTGYGDSQVVTTTEKLSNGSTNVIVASGVTDTSDFSGISSPNFGVPQGKASESGSNSNEVDANIFHGAPADPAAKGVDVTVLDSSGSEFTTFTDVAFGEFLTDKQNQGLAALPEDQYTIEIAPSGDSNNVGTFDLDLNGAGGAYRTIVASGFLNPSSQSGSSSEFKLLAVAPDGSVTALSNNQ